MQEKILYIIHYFRYDWFSHQCNGEPGVTNDPWSNGNDGVVVAWGVWEKEHGFVLDDQWFWQRWAIALSNVLTPYLYLK